MLPASGTLMRGGEWDRARRVGKGDGVGRGVGRRRVPRRRPTPRCVLPWPAGFYPDRRFLPWPAGDQMPLAAELKIGSETNSPDATGFISSLRPVSGFPSVDGWAVGRKSRRAKGAPRRLRRLSGGDVRRKLGSALPTINARVANAAVAASASSVRSPRPRRLLRANRNKSHASARSPCNRTSPVS